MKPKTDLQVVVPRKRCSHESEETRCFGLNVQWVYNEAKDGAKEHWQRLMLIHLGNILVKSFAQGTLLSVTLAPMFANAKRRPANNLADRLSQRVTTAGG